MGFLIGILAAVQTIYLKTPRCIPSQDFAMEMAQSLDDSHIEVRQTRDDGGAAIGIVETVSSGGSLVSLPRTVRYKTTVLQPNRQGALNMVDLWEECTD